MSKDTLIIDDERSSQSESGIEENTVILGDLLGEIGQQRNLEIFSQSTVSSGSLSIGHMREMGVNGTSDNFAVVLFELRRFIGEFDDFGWANEGEIQWVEEQENVFSLVVIELDVNKLLSGSLPSFSRK